jgi:hypothetical protein
MNDTRYCGNPDVLMAYLYEDGDSSERLAFDAHLRGCERCAAELASLRAVREDLAAWAPPETMLDFRIVRDPAPSGRRWGWMTAMPAWAQLAAASLVIGIAAGISGLDVRYGSDGLVVRTGWNRAADTQRAASPAPGTAAGASAPWRADLVTLQEQLRSELKQGAPAPAATPVSAAAANGGKPMSDQEFMARVKQLIEASETRTQREVALRVAEVIRDMDTQRRSDMRRVADGLGVLEGRTGAAVAQQREMMSYLMRVSQRQQ